MPQGRPIRQTPRAIDVHGGGAAPDTGSGTVLIKAGLIAAPGGRFVADLLVRDGWIASIGASGATAERVIDAMGLVVLPGWVLPLVPAATAETPAHRWYADAGITSAGWTGAEPRDRWCCDVVPMELIDTSERIAHAPRTIHERGRVAFVLPAGSDAALLDAAAQALARLRATLIVAAADDEHATVEAAVRAAAFGGRVAVGPLREPSSLRRAWSAGALAATDPAWLIDDPSLWREVAHGAVRLLVSRSGRPPGIDSLYRSGPARGLVGLEALAALLAARPAALLGCGAKGMPVPGREADLCILEPTGGDAVIAQTLLRGTDARRAHGRVIRAEPVDSLPAS